jgi:hypothetical protein
MKLCIEGDIYFIPKFHILETGTVKLSIETDLIELTQQHNCDISMLYTHKNLLLQIRYRTGTARVTDFPSVFF